MEEQKSSGSSFWQSMPGILTGLATTLAAVGGLVAALHSAGVIGNKDESTQAQTEATEIQADNPEYAASTAESEPVADQTPTEETKALADSVNDQTAETDPNTQNEAVAETDGSDEQPMEASADETVTTAP